MRVDLIAVSIVTVCLLGQFGWQLTDKEDLLAMGCMVLACLINGVLLLGNHWWVAYHELIAYQQLKGIEIEKCSHIKVIIDNKKAKIVKKFIVPIIMKHMEVNGKVISAHQVEVQKKKFSYSKERKTFSQIPYPTDDAIECYQSNEGITDLTQIKKADLVWGSNRMEVPIPEFI